MFYSINGIASCDRFEKEIIICVKDEVTGQLYDLWTKTSEHEIDGALVELYDLMLEYVFGDIESYYRIDHFLPSLTKLAGFDAESAMSSDSYNAMLQRINDNSLIKRDMLLVDLQFLIGPIQNLILSICKGFLNIYTCLSGITGNIQYFGNKTIFASGGNCEGVFSFLTSYFTKAYSILDITTKLAYEFQNDPGTYDDLKHLRSIDVLFGAKKRLSLYGEKDTIFEENSCINTIVSMRNELVHNGTWELRSKVYCEIRNDEIVRRFIPWPELRDGRLATVLNRRRFFSTNETVNEVLPVIHDEFMRRINITVKLMLEEYRTKLPHRSFSQTTGVSVEEGIQQILDFYNDLMKRQEGEKK